MFHEEGKDRLALHQYRGDRLPDWLQQGPPPIDEMLGMFYVEAFTALSTCRQIGMSEGPIPWRDVVEYADRARLDADSARVFVAVIRAMDAAYRKHGAERTQAKMDG